MRQDKPWFSNSDPIQLIAQYSRRTNNTAYMLNLRTDHKNHVLVADPTLRQNSSHLLRDPEKQTYINPALRRFKRKFPT